MGRSDADVRGAGRGAVRVVCHSCQLVRINGVVCHETGCPDAWRSFQPACKWCGSRFQPEHRGQTCCDDECYAAYRGE